MTTKRQLTLIAAIWILLLILFAPRLCGEIMKRLILAIAILLVPCWLMGATIYIDPTVSGTGTGTIGDPFKAWSSVTWAAGNSYLQKCGTTAALTGNGINPNVGGSEGNVITIGSYSTGAKPILYGGIETVAGTWTDLGSNKWEYYNASIDTDWGIGNIMYNGTTAAVRVETSGALTTQGMYWNDKTNRKVRVYSVGSPGAYYTSIIMSVGVYGIKIRSIGYFTIQDLNFWYFGASDINCAGLAVGTPANYITIQRCDSHYCGGMSEGSNGREGNSLAFGAWLDHITVDSCTIDNAYDAAITNQCSDGFTGATQTNLLYKNNYITHCHYGYEAFNASPTGSCSNVYFVNNTVTYSGSWSLAQRSGKNTNFYELAAMMGATNYNIENNIFYMEDTGGGAYSGYNWVFAPEAGSYTIDYNCYYTTVAGSRFQYGPAPCTYYTFSTWKSTRGYDAHSIEIDPSITGYVISSNSPCKDAGTTLGTVITDIRGLPRPFNGLYDIGAYEYSSPTIPTSYYVKTGGNDASAGTADGTAWALCPGMTGFAGGGGKTLSSGDTVYFRSQDTWSGTPTLLTSKAGVTYNGDTYGSGTRAKFLTNGIASGKPLAEIITSNVTFKGFEIDGDGIDGAGLYVWTKIGSETISNIVIDNCIVHDIGDASAVHWNYGLLVSPYAANASVQNITIQNCTAYNTAHEGILLYPTWSAAGTTIDTALIKNCIAHDVGLCLTSGYASGFIVSNAVNNATLDGNTAYNCAKGIIVNTHDEGIGYDTGSPTNIVIKNNNLYGNDVGLRITTGLLTAYADNMSVLVYNNFIHDNDGYLDTISNTSGINFSGEGGAGISSGTASLTFYNNTIYEVTSGKKSAVCFGNDGDVVNGTPTITFKNNIVYSNDYPAIHDYYNLLNDFGTHTNNLIFRTSSAAHTHVYISGASQARAGVTTWEATAQNTDPLLTGYTIPSNSPCRDTGITVPSVTTDIVGNRRKLVGLYDIGCYEIPDVCP